MGKYVIVCRAPGYVRQEGSSTDSLAVARALLPRLAAYYTARGYKGTPREDGMAIALHDRAGIEFGTIRVEKTS